jgi:hypothetical protein
MDGSIVMAGGVPTQSLCKMPILEPHLLSFRAAFGEESVVGEHHAAGEQQIPPFDRNDKINR